MEREIQIRIATERDIKIITDFRFDFLEEENVYNLNRKILEEASEISINDRNIEIFILNINSEDIGICIISAINVPGVFRKENMKFGYLTNLFIKKKYRKQNLGKEFLLRIEDRMKKEGMEKIILQCSEELNGFYESAGYSKKEYYIKK